MFKWLKKHFIPHEGNAHRPHFLHRRNASQLVGIILVFELALFILPALNFTGFINSLNLGAVLPGVLSTLTNERRVEENLWLLVENPLLMEAARLKAEDMAAKSYFAHTSPEGKTPWYWLDLAGYKYAYAGENLAVHFLDSRDVTEAWMNSPTHRANIVHGAYTEIGTGIATGVYKGYETVFVAQVYGRPRTPVKTGGAGSEFLVASEPTSGGLSAGNSDSAPEAQTAVLGETAPVEKSPSITRLIQEGVKEFFQGAAASPRHTTDAVLYSVLSIVTLALLFNIFIKHKHHHPDLILNGAVVTIIILGLHLVNGFISKEQSLTTSFIAYDSLNQVLNQE